MSEPLRWPIRVYWEDTDAGGVVYHAAYVRFLERARSEWLRSRGVVQSRLKAERGLQFALTDMSLKFLAPARLDDELLATCVLSELRGASFRFSQELIRPVDNAVLVRADVRAACLSAGTLRPRPLPEEMKLE
jgi:acyl-CoA thioester hydrolase